MGLALCIFLKWQGPSLVTAWFKEGQFSLLNTLTHSSANQSLDFYLGRTEETLFGPIFMLVSGLILAGFCFLYLEGSSLIVLSSVIFLYFILTRWEVLFFPPYGDAIGGPFTEAMWLKEHHFNYFGLYHAPSYNWGGPRVYLFSVYPSFLALLMVLIPHVKTFLVVNHLIVFAMAALTVALFKNILQKVWDEKISTLTALLVLSQPLFQSQAEAITMEMPGLFFVVLTCYFLVQKRFAAASVMSIIATLVRDTAMTSCWAVFITAIVVFVNKEGSKKERWKMLGWGSAALAFTVFRVLLKFLLADQHASSGMIRLLAGWPSFRWSLILCLYTVSLISFAVRFLKEKKFRFIPFVLFLMAAAWYSLFLNFYAVSPRYRLTLLPFLVFCVFYTLEFFIKNKKIQMFCLVGFLSLSFFSAYGLFYTPMEENDHVLLERSLEYRNDLKVYQRLAKRLEVKKKEYTIGAPFVAAQILAIPQLGYVDRPLDVVIYGMRSMYGPIKTFEGLKTIDASRTIWVGFKTNLPKYLDRYFEYPIGPYDVILEDIVVGNKKASIFMGGTAIEKLRVAEEYLIKNKAVRKPSIPK